MISLVIVSTLVWIAQDQFQRIDLVPYQVSLVILSAVLALFVAWVAWRARGQWRPAAVGAVALTIGIQGADFFRTLSLGSIGQLPSIGYLGDPRGRTCL